MDLDETLRDMREHGIDRAVLGPAGEFSAVLNREGNDEIAGVIRQSSDCFIGFATVNPWMRTKSVDELRRARQDLGLAGLVLNPQLQGFEANDALVFPLVEEAIRLQMPVYVSGGAPLLAVPYKIADLAQRYPEGKFVLGHAGWDFHYDVAACLDMCPNLWCETSRVELCILQSLVRAVGAGRFLFGSDYPFSSFLWEVEKVRMLPRLSKVDRNAILHTNACKLLGIGEEK